MLWLGGILYCHGCVITRFITDDFTVGDERRPKCNNCIIPVESNIRYRVCDGDIVDLLFDIRMLSI